MPNTLLLTAAARTQLADGQNLGTRAVTITRVAVGDQHGVAEATETSARTTMRNERDDAVAGGATNVSGRIAVRAEIVPGAAYAVSEVGLFARVETDPEFLFAYWTDDGAVLVNAALGTRTVVAAVVDIVGAAADVAVTVSPTVALSGVAALVDLTDTPDALVADHYLRATSPAGAAVENVSAATVLDHLLQGLSDGDTVRVRVQAGVRSLERIELASVVSQAFDLQANVEVTRMLGTLADYRFFVITAGSDATGYQSLYVPLANIPRA